MYFIYRQNNSGGYDVRHDKLGIGNFVIIEAKNAAQANERAETIGLYFNGVEAGSDCECCGDRWDICSDDDAVNSLEEETFFPGFNTYLHRLNGTIEKLV